MGGAEAIPITLCRTAVMGFAKPRISVDGTSRSRIWSGPSTEWQLGFRMAMCYRRSERCGNRGKCCGSPEGQKPRGGDVEILEKHDPDP
jgi:hypothetical protein